MAKFSRSVFLWFRQFIQGDSFSVHGISVSVPKTIDQEIRYHLARGRPYEDPEAKFIDRFLSTNTQVIELGGSLGIVSALIRKKIGPQALHVIVEANENLARVGLKNAKVGLRTGVTKMVTAAVDYSGKETVKFHLGHNSHVGKVSNEGIEVPTVTLKKLCEMLTHKNAALVCDIEGAEFDLVFADTMAFENFDTIIMETHPKEYQNGATSLSELLAELNKMGFTEVAQEADVFVLKRGDK